MEASGNMLQVKDLTVGLKSVDIEGEVKNIEDEREVNLRTGGEARVADAQFVDASGSMKFTLWGDQIDNIQEGSRVRITRGYVGSFRGEKQLQVGKYGRLEVLIKDPSNVDKPAYYRDQINKALAPVAQSAKNADELDIFRQALMA